MNTEQLKRQMYTALADCKLIVGEGRAPIHNLPWLESSLEEYLEALRQDLKTAHEATGELAIQLQETKAEHDTLRNKLQAFEYANKNAGELLRDALATVKRQRAYIRTLYTSRKAHKAKPATRIQSSQGNGSESKCGPSGGAIRATSESCPSFPLVMHLEFADRVRTTCTACNQTTDVMK